MKNRLILSFILVISSLFVVAQNKEDLEKKRSRLVKEIEFTRERLKEISKEKQISLSEITLLRKQINNRENLIENITSEIDVINSVIDKNNAIIVSLQSDLKNMQTEYVVLLKSVYKNRVSFKTLLFVFSAGSFNEAWQRIRYMRKFNEYRIDQANLIKQTQLDIQDRLKQSKKQLQEKSILVESKEKEKLVYVEETERKKAVVDDLKKNEKELKKQLEAQQKARNQLNTKIESIIKREIALAEAEAKRKAKLEEEERLKNNKNKSTKPAPPVAEKGSSSSLSASPEAKEISTNFAVNKGKLHWPVSQGFISETYGQHEHPDLPGIITVNNGINIKTSPGQLAKSIYGGEVTSVFTVPGMQKNVIIRHGEFLTVYSHLDETYVKVGDKVNVDQNIGKVFTDPNSGKTEIHLEIWKGTEKLNPQSWIQ